MTRSSTSRSLLLRVRIHSRPMSFLDEYAAQVVSEMPDPPRAVPMRTILAHMYRTSEGRWMVGLGLALGLPATIVFAFAAQGDLWAKILGLAIVVPTTVALLGTPAWASLRLARALASGIRVQGEILRARWQGPESAIPTIAAASHGMTRGTRRVFHPAGEFDESFESDAAWADELVPGAQVAVLAHPAEQRVLFDLGPIQDRSPRRKAPPPRAEAHPRSASGGGQHAQPRQRPFRDR
jgi:hypothetical protein